MEPKAQRQMLDGEYTHRSGQLTIDMLSYFFSWFSSYLPSSAVKKYHPNGNVKSNKEFDDEGQLHGKMEEWYANGHVRALPVP